MVQMISPINARCFPPVYQCVRKCAIMLETLHVLKPTVVIIRTLTGQLCTADYELIRFTDQQFSVLLLSFALVTALFILYLRSRRYSPR